MDVENPPKEGGPMKPGDLVRVMRRIELWSESGPGGNFVGLFKPNDVALIVQSDRIEDISGRWMTYKVCTSRGTIGWVYDETHLMRMSP